MRHDGERALQTRKAIERRMRSQFGTQWQTGLSYAQPMALFGYHEWELQHGERLAQFLPNDQLEPGPYVGDGADLDVDQAVGKGDVPDGVFRNIGRHLGGFLGPRNPDGGIDVHRGACGGECALQTCAFRAEDVNKVGLAIDLAMKRNRRGVGAKPGVVVRRLKEQGDPHAGLEAELCGQRFS